MAQNLCNMPQKLLGGKFLDTAILDCVLSFLTILCTKETSGQSMKDISSVQQQGETGFQYPTEAQQQQGVRGH